MEISRPPLGNVERERGRGFWPETRRPTVLHTQPPEDMDDISRHALIIARWDALHSNTARLCHERWESFCTTLDYGPPPPAADQERLPKDLPKVSEVTYSPESPADQTPTLPKTKVRRATAQLKLDDQPSSPSQDQPNQVPSTLQGALDHHHGSPGRKGHIADGSDKGRLKKDSIYSKPISRTDPLPYAALNQPTSITDIEEWPQLPGPGAQDLHGPTLQSLALPRESPADTPMAPPMAIQQAQKQQETAIHSTE